MPDYRTLLANVSHRVTFEYDTGVKVIGYLAATSPAAGQVLLVKLSQADVYDALGHVLEHHDELSLVPNVLVSIRTTEGPERRLPRE